MNKIGIITLYHNNRNYGGLLQAYALQKEVESMGYDCEVIDYTQDQRIYKLARIGKIGLKKNDIKGKGNCKNEIYVQGQPNAQEEYRVEKSEISRI